MSTEQNPENIKQKPVKRKHVQEKFMIMLTAIFFLGVVVYMVAPSEGGLRAASMATYTCFVMFVIFKWGF